MPDGLLNMVDKNFLHCNCILEAVSFGYVSLKILLIMGESGCVFSHFIASLHCSSCDALCN